MDADTFFLLQQTQAMEEDQAEDDWEQIVVAGATIVLGAEQDAYGRNVIRIAKMASLMSQFGLFCVASSIRGVPTPRIDED
jgi:hypothetical protein